MNDSDTSSSEDGDDHIYHHDDAEVEVEAEVEAETAAAAAAATSERRRLDLLKVVSVLQRKVTYPTRTIKKIDILVDEFLLILEDDVSAMLCSNDADDNSYQGLDSNIDTEAEVEAIIRIFPNVLSKRKRIMWTDEDADHEHEERVLSLYLPIQLLAFTIHEDESLRINLKAVSFIPVVARLAIEFGCFDDKLRGGLLCHGTYPYDDANVLQNLMNSDSTLMNSDFTEIHNRDHHEHIEDMYLQVLIHLRQTGLLKKEDIQRYDLLHKICRISNYFAEKRFRFLVEWDPAALTQTVTQTIGNNRFIPLHFAAIYSTLQGFRVVFEYGIRYYPKKKGICLLFKKNNFHISPFQIACGPYKGMSTRGNKMSTINDTLIDCQRRRRRRRHSEEDEDEDDSNTSGPYNIVDALVTAAIDENIHLDCVYFLIRREPDVLQKLLLSKQTVVAATTVKLDSSSSNSNNRNNSGYDSKQRKRKR